MARYDLGETSFLIPAGLRRKPLVLMQSLARSYARNGGQGRVIQEYKPCDTLFLYGWGGNLQQRAIQEHGGNYVAFDLGYWERDGFSERKWRVSINGFHCPDLIMRGTHPGASKLRDSRIDARGIKVSGNRVLLVGNGPKSQKVGAKDWSAVMSKRIRQAMPDAEIWYKPKPKRPIERFVDYDEFVDGDIASILRSVSLVVCRHSNVAVDACRLGVPVVCEDGAAACIYPHTLEERHKQPAIDLRREFLERLAWWQWTIAEISRGQFWPWIRRQLAAV